MKNGFRLVRKTVVRTKEEINQILRDVVSCACPKNIHNRNRGKDEPLKDDVFIWETRCLLHVLVKWGTATKHWVFDLDGKYRSGLAGADATQLFLAHNRGKADEERPQKCKDFKIRIKNEFGERDLVGTALPLLWFNPNWKGRREGCYSYDKNKAYLSKLVQPMPDLRTVRKNDLVGEGEIGFTSIAMDPGKISRIRSGLILEKKAVGEYAEWVFKTMPSPYAKGARWAINALAHEEDPDVRRRIKDMVNMFVGELENTNPFARATVVEGLNEEMLPILDKYRDRIAYINTDGLGVQGRIPELDRLIGSEVGDFKLEHEDAVLYLDGSDYQYNEEMPIIRGMAKVYIERYKRITGKNFRLGIDDLPEEYRTMPSYRLDWKTKQVKENKINEKKTGKKAA